MGVIDKLKVLKNDKRIINDPYIKKLGGKERIQQFLGMDKQVIAEINLFLSELKRLPKDIKRDEKSGLLLENIWVKLRYLEMSVRKETRFVALLRSTLESGGSRIKEAEDNMFRDAIEGLGSAAREIETVHTELEHTVDRMREYSYANFDCKVVVRFLEDAQSYLK
jgi:hypothetical protein